MKNFFLFFSKDDYEEEYFELFKPKITNMTKLNLIFIYLLVTVNMFIDLSFNNYSKVYYQLILLGFLFLLTIFLIKYIRFLNAGISLLNLLFSVVFGAILQKYFASHTNPEHFFLVGFAVGVFHMNNYQSTNWIISNISLLFIGIIYFANFFSKNFLDISVIFTILIAICNNYLEEKSRREIFFTHKKDEHHSKMWKYVMLEIYPDFTAIIQLKMEKFLTQSVPNSASKIKKRSWFLKLVASFKMKTKKIDSPEDKIIELDLEESTNQINLDCVNEYAEREFQVSTTEDFQLFLKNLEIEAYNDGETINEIMKDMLVGDPNTFSPTVVKSSSKNNQNFPNCKKITGTYEFKNIKNPNLPQGKIKVRIILCKFFWNGQLSLLFRMERIDLEEQIARLEELDKYKDQILASVTHDLRTPLNGINFMLEKAKNCPDKEKLTNYLEMGQANSDLLLSLINDILDYSQLRENRLRLNVIQFNIENTLNYVIKLMGIQANLKGIELKLENNLKPESIVSDERRLKQVLINLTSNALKFTLQGYQQNNIIYIQVKDSGVGIKEEVIPNLCKPFATYDTNGINKQGIGLGLNICRKIIGLLGPKEELIIKSKYGKGSSFGFLFYANINKNENVNSDPELPDKEIDIELSNSNSEISNASSQNLTKILKNSNNNLYPESYTHKDSKLSISNSNEDNASSFKNIKSEENSNLSSFRLERESINSPNSPECKSLTKNSPSRSNFVQTEKNKTVKKTSLEEIEFDVHTYTEKSKLSKSSKPKKIKKNKMLKQSSSICTNTHKKTYKEKTKKELTQRFNTIDSQNKNKINILIVDDNMFNLMILESFIEKITKYSIHIEKANNGLNAVELFKVCNQHFCKRTLDIIIMDCEMPILNGYDASKEIKKKVADSSYLDVIIVAYTSFSGEDEEKKCREYGMNEYLLKPTTEEEFQALLLNIIENDKKNEEE